jgi:hypothetical protein
MNNQNISDSLIAFWLLFACFYSQFTAKISQNQPKSAKISQNQPKTAKSS